MVHFEWNICNVAYYRESLTITLIESRYTTLYKLTFAMIMRETAVNDYIS